MKRAVASMVVCALVAPAVADDAMMHSECRGSHTGHDDGCCATLPPTHSDEVSSRGACPDEQVIDVLWACTPEARDAAGGIDVVLDACRFAVDDANITFANTGLPFSVRIVGLHMTDYVEGDSAYLYHLQNPSDGYMDEVPVLRNAKAADIVALVTLQGYCGVAFVAPASPDWGYQADTIGCLLQANPFRHELGHNLGSKHWSNDSGGYFPWSAGHVLTLGDGSEVGTAMGGNSIAHYSNPNVLYDGVPTGIPAGEPGQADNFDAFTVTVPMVANFRCSTSGCPADVTLDGVVNVDDLIEVIGAWGECSACPADVAFSGQVDVHDVLLVVSDWGDSP